MAESFPQLASEFELVREQNKSRADNDADLILNKLTFLMVRTGRLQAVHFLRRPYFYMVGRIQGEMGFAVRTPSRANTGKRGEPNDFREDAPRDTESQQAPCQSLTQLT